MEEKVKITPGATIPRSWALWAEFSSEDRHQKNYDLADIIALEEVPLENMHDVTNFLDMLAPEITANLIVHKPEFGLGNAAEPKESSPKLNGLSPLERYLIQEGVEPCLIEKGIRWLKKYEIFRRSSHICRRNINEAEKGHPNYRSNKPYKKFRYGYRRPMPSSRTEVEIQLHQEESLQIGKYGANQIPENTSGIKDKIEITYKARTEYKMEIRHTPSTQDESESPDLYTQNLIKMASNGSLVFSPSDKPPYETNGLGILEDEELITPLGELVQLLGDSEEESLFFALEGDKIGKYQDQSFVPMKRLTKKSKLKDIKDHQSVAACTFSQLAGKDKAYVDNIVSGIYRDDPLKTSDTERI